jgi:hypothetical protein
MLDDVPEARLPEVIDFLRYMKEKNGDAVYTDNVYAKKKLLEWDALVEAIRAAKDEEVTDFERVNFERETVL